MKPLIEIILEGQVYAQRNWDQIPRVGDTVLLKDGEVWALVERVVWSNDTQVRHEDRLWVQLICSAILREPRDIDTKTKD